MNRAEYIAKCRRCGFEVRSVLDAEDTNEDLLQKGADQALEIIAHCKRHGADDLGHDYKRYLDGKEVPTVTGIVGGTPPPRKH